VIFEVPYFFGTTVATHVTPGNRWMEQALVPSPLTESGLRSPGQLAPFDPTPHEVVERMLTLAGVKKGDVVYDLGSGDGRIAIAAAKKYGAKSVGFEIDPGLVKLARENVRKEGVEDLVQIRQQDFTKADLSPATVVTLYLSQDGNAAVKPLLQRQLKPGARVVSYTFDMGDWPPKVVETYRDASGDSHLLYRWDIPEPPVYSENPSLD
jgi:SAM-dependent methyltransferase